jgi:transketolase
MEKYPFAEKKDTRAGFGKGLMEAARKNENVVALCADLIGSLKMDEFVKEYPHRFFQVGIAEANMTGIAAGLATTGKIPFIGTFSVFATGRNYDQVRQSVAYSNKNVKIAGSHAGLTLGEDGATHQILEDIGLMKMLPNMVVINPCDFNQTKAATLAAAEYVGPVYLRFGRPAWPVFTPENQVFEIGKAVLFEEGTDVSIFATGHMVWNALKAWEILKDEGISAEIINIHTIKPIDQEAIIKSASKTLAVVSAEEHNYHGGLGESISRVLAQNIPVPMEFVAVNDTFGQSGQPEELLDAYHLGIFDIVNAAKMAIARKK